VSLGSQRAGSSALQLRLGVYSRACRHRRLGFLPAESLFVDGLLFGAANLLLGLAPVVEFRPGLIGSDFLRFMVPSRWPVFGELLYPI